MLAALLDTSVLYPMYLRDTLLRVAAQELYRPLWSAHILDELGRTLRETAGIDPDAVVTLLDLMTQHFPDSEVQSYETLIGALDLPDPDDRHVLAAAITGGAEVVVTANVRDFPEELEETYLIEVQSPDAFLLERFEEYPEGVRRALDEQVRPYRNPPLTEDELLGRLALPSFAKALRSG